MARTSASTDAPDDSDESTISPELEGGQVRTTGIPGAPIHELPRERPESSGLIIDHNHRYVGNFNVSNGWVSRRIDDGHGPNVTVVASIDDVLRAVWSFRAPRTEKGWIDWFIRNGQTWSPGIQDAPNYENRGPHDSRETGIPHEQLRAISGFDDDGNPRIAAASMAGPLVVGSPGTELEFAL